MKKNKSLFHKNYNRIFYYFTFLVICIITSCSASKEVKKTKKEAQTEIKKDIGKKGTIITEEIQEGGKTSIRIIPLGERERDEMGELKEMIKELKDGGVTGRVRYYKDGSADCECDTEALQRKIIELYEQRDESIIKNETKESAKEKEESFKISNTVILAIMGGLTLLGGIVIFLMFKKIDTSSKAFHLALKKIVN